MHINVIFPLIEGCRNVSLTVFEKFEQKIKFYFYFSHILLTLVVFKQKI